MCVFFINKSLKFHYKIKYIYILQKKIVKRIFHFLILIIVIEILSERVNVVRTTHPLNFPVT